MSGRSGLRSDRERRRAALVALLACALTVPQLITGCFPVVAVATTTVLVATDRRTTGAQLDDTTIGLKLMTEIESRFGDRVHVNVTSYNGIVLLTGEVPDQATWAEIGSLAKSTERVRNVVNELVLGPPTDLERRANDTYITSLVKSRFVEASSQFSPTHVKVVTERNVVYLMGLVKKSEGDAAARIASTTSGVARVVKVFEYIE